MKTTINPWIMFYLGLVVVGAAILGVLFLVVAQQEREQMILVFGITVAGGGILIIGFIGLLVILIKDLLQPAAKKEPIQLPETTRGKRP